MASFWQGKRVFVTGHTGFKGSWLTEWLCENGAEATGFALPPEKDGLFLRAGLSEKMNSISGDIRNFDALSNAFEKAKPEIVFHLAAQPIVLEGYRAPLYTYETNVLGTLNLLECIRGSDTVRSFLNVTTDKVYENRETGEAFREDEKLDGFDPYSNSKSCSELVTHCYDRSFLKEAKAAVSTARAGNVIGGGDEGKNRLVPDCIRAALQKQPIEVRNPFSIRPFQHVLEPLFVYQMIAERQYDDLSLCGSYNVGPDEADCLSSGELTDLFCRAWGNGQTWKTHSTEGPHEAKLLRLDCTKLKKTFGWQPRMNIEDAVRLTVDFAKREAAGENAADLMAEQIYLFERS